MNTIEFITQLVEDNINIYKQLQSLEISQNFFAFI